VALTKDYAKAEASPAVFQPPEQGEPDPQISAAETSDFNQCLERLPNEEVICHFSAQMKMGYYPEEISPYHAPCHAQIVPHQTLRIPDRLSS
jgi:hypothetical protein